MSLLDRFLSTAEQMANATIVVDDDGSHTYGELALLARQVAAHILEQHISPGDRIALLLANSHEYIGVFYGVWCAGGVTVALNTQAKAKDLENWLNHSGSSILFADSGHPELAALQERVGDRLHIVPVSRGGQPSKFTADSGTWETIANSSPLQHHHRCQDHDVASIIYTSGTTGAPKGVTLSHGNLLSNTDAIIQYLSLTNTDSIVNVLPFYYSYGNSVMHTHLAAGARIVLENSMLYPQRVLKKIQSECVSGFSGVPSTFSLLTHRTKLHDFDLSCLRYITQAGGPMPPVITDRLRAALPNVALFIMYGQTEASARLTYLPPDDLPRKRGSVGIPVPGVTIELRNGSETVATADVSGEICVKGDNVMLGYWNAPEKTAEVLRDGWLHTGDLGHFDKDGYLYIDGRSSDMIKSGGNRISPQEIEETLCELDGIYEAAAKGVEDDLLGEVIKAYIVLESNSNLSKLDIQRHCKEHLSIYKIPKLLEFIDEIPRTSSGKIQRHLLK